MKYFGLWIWTIKGVPLYKNSSFSHNLNKKTWIPLRFGFLKNPWFPFNFLLRKVKSHGILDLIFPSHFKIIFHELFHFILKFELTNLWSISFPFLKLNDTSLLRSWEKVVKSTFWMSNFESNLIWFWPQKSEW